MHGMAFRVVPREAQEHVPQTEPAVTTGELRRGRWELEGVLALEHQGGVLGGIQERVRSGEADQGQSFPGAGHSDVVQPLAQKQGTQAGTYYKSPDKGLNVACQRQGRSFLGRGVENQTAQLFRGFILREDWIDWISDNQLQNADPGAALQTRRSIEEKMERARHLYIDGDITKAEYSRMKQKPPCSAYTFRNSMMQSRRANS